MSALSQPIVIKLGGSIFETQGTVLADLVALQNEGHRLVLVHGGAKMITKWCTGLGITSQFHQGERITDRRSLEVVTAILAGLANKETVAALVRAGGRAMGISGVDGTLIRARVKNGTLGYIGEVEGVDPHPLNALLAAGYLPVVSPVSYHDTNLTNEPLLLNLNGDTAAGAIAGALGATKLIFLTDVDGLRGGDGVVIPELDPPGVQELLATGVASGGMVPKLRACLGAVQAGIVCHIVDGSRPRALIEVLLGTATGTTLHPRE